MKMNRISAVVITYNEERNIARCLESLQGLSDEILVVDSFSGDDTEKFVHNSMFVLSSTPLKTIVIKKSMPPPWPHTTLFSPLMPMSVLIQH